MKSLLEEIKRGYRINREEARELVGVDLDKLVFLSKELKDYYNKDIFNICGIINGKNGACTEDCKFCAQAVTSKNKDLNIYPLRDKEDLLEEARINRKDGIYRMAIVSSGRKLNKKELNKISETYKYISKKTDILLCASHGLLTYEELKTLKESGVSRYHCNLEASENYFSQICTSHSYWDRVETIKKAQKAGLEICSGGIIGTGESMEDRIDLALALRDLSIKSIPVNVLLPIEGTDLENVERLDYKEILRSFSIFKIINPDAYIRFAAGRRYTDDLGKEIFLTSSNAMISGRLLNTPGMDTKRDMDFIKDLGFEIVK